jgi:hypothetical protein
MTMRYNYKEYLWVNLSDLFSMGNAEFLLDTEENDAMYFCTSKFVYL